MIRAIDELGVTVDYVTATRWSIDAAEGRIDIWTYDDLTASVPGQWLVRVLPFSQVDPGVNARE